MPTKLWRLSAGAAALAAIALVGTAVALAAGGSRTRAAATTTGTAPARPAHTPETPLTGDVLAKAEAAAIAKVGGTAVAATTENDGTDSAAAYEVHVTKADGTRVTVVLDKAYAVLSVETGGPDGRGHGPGGPFGPGGHGPGGGNGEIPLTSDVATRATTAAVAKVGGTANFATTETDGGNSAAAYEVHVTKADGSHVTVILDKDYNVLTVEDH